MQRMCRVWGNVPYETLGLQLLNELDAHLVFLLFWLSALLPAFRLCRLLAFLVRERDDNLERLRQGLCRDEFSGVVMRDRSSHASIRPIWGLLGELKDTPLDALERGA